MRKSYKFIGKWKKSYILEHVLGLNAKEYIIIYKNIDLETERGETVFYFLSNENSQNMVDMHMS